MENQEFAYKDTDIAIIGMSGRLPSAKDLSAFWENLSGGKECLTRFSKDDLIAEGLSEKMINNPDYVPVGGVLPDYDQFDEAFFGYSPKEAIALDPQYRIFLEESWKALEDAAYNPDTYAGNIGVFAGCKNNAASYLQEYLNSKESKDLSPFEIGVFSETSQLVTRVAYDLNLTGPAIQIQTACSTSLVAIHMACVSLLMGDSDMALAGGITLLMPPKSGYTYQEGLVYSPDGKCRSFDEKAAGTIMSNGVGVIVLKRLTDALADKDHIRAIIKSSAINNDGKKKISYTAPSVPGQKDVIRTAIDLAQINPETISYVEAHGTATIVGDPIEINALTEAFREFTSKNNFCAIGSVKTNIGHLDVAAGVVGVIKTVLSMENKTIPATLHFESPNPHIDFKNTPFYVQNKKIPWHTEENIPRRAGVSAFGIGGTNAHIILEEAPIQEMKNESDGKKILCVSGKTKTALEKNLAKLLQFLENNITTNLEDIAYTLYIGRKHFKHKAFIVCNDIREAIESIRNRRLLENIPEKDLAELYNAKKYNRLSLPNYEFDRNKFWVKKTDKDNSSSVKNLLNVQAENVNSNFSLKTIQKELTAIWVNVFGNENIDTNDNFFDLGGTSLLALRIVTKVYEKFDIKPPTTWVYTNDTIVKQIKKLEQELKKNGRIEKMEDNKKEVITFNESDHGIPLFLIHPSRAGAEVYYRLAYKLGKNFPCYGIESHNLNCAVGDYILSIEALATSYIKSLKAIKPQGPYILGGWSMGGIIAYEMAQQLTASGDTILNIYMFDSAVTTQLKIDHYLKVMPAMKKIASINGTLNSKIEKVIEIECAMLSAYHNYHPYNKNVILFKAENIVNKAPNDTLTKDEALAFNEMFSSISADSKNGWGPYLNNLSIINMKCCHETILSAGHLDTIASTILNDIKIRS